MSDFSVHPRDLLAKVPQLDVRELEWTSFAGAPLFNANLAGGKSQLLSPDGVPVDRFSTNRIIGIVKSAVPNPETLDIQVIHQYDLYYLDRNRETAPSCYTRADERRGEHTLLHRSEVCPRRLDIQQPELGESLARLRTSLA